MPAGVRTCQRVFEAVKRIDSMVHQGNRCILLRAGPLPLLRGWSSDILKCEATWQRLHAEHVSAAYAAHERCRKMTWSELLPNHLRRQCHSLPNASKSPSYDIESYLKTFYTSEWDFWGHAWSTKGSVLRLEAVERTANDTLPCLCRKHVTCNLTPANWLWGVAILPVPFSGLAAIWVWWAGALGALWQSEVKAHWQRIAENSRLLQMLLSNTLGIKLRYMSDCYCSVWNIFLRRQGWMQFYPRHSDSAN